MTLWNGQKVQSSKKSTQTHRFVIDLEEPSDSNTNECSYASLLNDVLQKQQKNGAADDPFEKNDDAKLAAMARRFEEKYGPKKRKRVTDEQDLIDSELGYGYDVSDPFVDDSELYDGYVPPGVDTKLGGFYINTGELEFLQSTDMEYSPCMPVKKKPKIKKQPSGTPKTILANKKLKLAKQIASSAQRVKQGKVSKKIPSVIRRNILAGSQNKSSSFKPTSHTSAEANGSSLGSVSPMKTTGTINSSSPEGMGNSSQPPLFLDSESKEPKVPPVLPTDLPAQLSHTIQDLEQTIRDNEDKDGKLSAKARSTCDDVLSMIDYECKGLKNRTAVLEYVAYKFGVVRSSLVSRLKRIQKKKEVDSLETPISHLKEAVDAVMEFNKAKYEQELKACAEQHAKKIEEMAEMKSQMESSLQNDPEASTASAIDQMKMKKPRKKFTWTPEIKSRLEEVMRLKVKSELANRVKPQNGDEIIMEFIEQQIKAIWPKGWIQKKELYKMTESIHTPLTGGSSQAKKAPAPKKDKAVIVKKEDSNSVTTPEVTGSPPPLVSAIPSSPNSTSPLVSKVKSVLSSSPQKISPQIVTNSKVQTGIGISTSLQNVVKGQPLQTSTVPGTKKLKLSTTKTSATHPVKKSIPQPSIGISQSSGSSSPKKTGVNSSQATSLSHVTLTPALMNIIGSLQTEESKKLVEEIKRAASLPNSQLLTSSQPKTNHETVVSTNKSLSNFTFKKLPASKLVSSNPQSVINTKSSAVKAKNVHAIPTLNQSSNSLSSIGKLTPQQTMKQYSPPQLAPKFPPSSVPVVTAAVNSAHSTIKASYQSKTTPVNITTASRPTNSVLTVPSHPVLITTPRSLSATIANSTVIQHSPLKQQPPLTASSSAPSYKLITNPSGVISLSTSPTVVVQKSAKLPSQIQGPAKLFQGSVIPSQGVPVQGLPISAPQVQGPSTSFQSTPIPRVQALNAPFQSTPTPQVQALNAPFQSTPTPRVQALNAPFQSTPTPRVQGPNASFQGLSTATQGLATSGPPAQGSTPLVPQAPVATVITSANLHGSLLHKKN